MNNRITLVTRVVIWLTVIILSLGGCAITKDIEASSNRDKLSELHIGMSKDEVLQDMGKPWKTEAFMKDDKPHVVLYYVTQRIPDGTTTDEEMTPVVFRDGTLIGWGRRFFSDLRIEVKQTGDN